MNSLNSIIRGNEKQTFVFRQRNDISNGVPVKFIIAYGNDGAGGDFMVLRYSSGANLYALVGQFDDEHSAVVRANQLYEQYQHSNETERHFEDLQALTS